ncbi:MAG: transposase [Chromatiales bacterium]|nr:transposase [Chromatiales bacterium]
MRGKHFSEEQIIKAIKSHENGTKVSDICRELGIVEQTFYRWRAKYSGMEVSEAKRLKTLEVENNKLKKMLAESMMDCATLKELLSKKW